MRIRQLLADALRRVDEFDGVVVVFLDAGGNREDVGVENYILRRKPDHFRQQLVGALANLELAVGCVGLSFLVERHDDGGRAVALHLAGMVEKGRCAFLEADGIHHRLALHTFQASLDHLPFRRVDHDRHPRNIGLGGDEVQEPDHRRLRIEHPLIHVDIDDLRAVFHLLARDVERLVEAILDDQLFELGGARHIGALANVDEVRSRLSHGILYLTFLEENDGGPKIRPP